MTTINFTTEQAIRERGRTAPEGWVDTQLRIAREAGLLLTERQHADLQAGRRFKVGDLARYVGPTRFENTDDDKYIERVHGQEGYIAEAVDGVILFMPHEAPKTGLRVREMTKCGFTLERA